MPDDPKPPDLVARLGEQQPEVPQTSNEREMAQLGAYFTNAMKEFGKYSEATAKIELEAKKADHAANFKTLLMGAVLLGLIFVSLLSIAFYALAKDKDAFATKLIETLITALISGFGGWGIGSRKKSKAAD